MMCDHAYATLFLSHCSLPSLSELCVLCGEKIKEWAGD